MKIYTKIEASLYTQNLLLKSLRLLRQNLEQYDGEPLIREHSKKGLITYKFGELIFEYFDDEPPACLPGLVAAGMILVGVTGFLSFAFWGGRINNILDFSLVGITIVLFLDITISSIYNYLISGRCNSLYGNGGAYSIFEKERRHGKMCDTLDDRVNPPENPNANQHMLHSALHTCRKSSDEITKYLSNLDLPLSGMESSDRLTAFNSYIHAQNAKMLEWLDLFEKSNNADR